MSSNNNNNTIYKILVEDREFKSWSIYETKQFQKVELDIHPVQQKLFSDDTLLLMKTDTLNWFILRCGLDPLYQVF